MQAKDSYGAGKRVEAFAVVILVNFILFELTKSFYSRKHSSAIMFQILSLKDRVPELMHAVDIDKMPFSYFSNKVGFVYLVHLCSFVVTFFCGCLPAFFNFE